MHYTGHDRGNDNPFFVKIKKISKLKHVISLPKNSGYIENYLISGIIYK